jgi:hypothetical protein
MANFQSMTINSIAKAYLSIVQTASKSSNVTQILDINCSSSNNESCLNCYKEMKQLNLGNDAISTICKNLCECNISNIDISQNVSIDFKSFQDSKSAQTFKNEIMNNMFLEAKKEGTSLFFDPEGSRQTTINNSIDNLYTNMITNDFSSAVQSSLNQQIVKIKANNVYNISLDSLSNITSIVIQNSESINESLNKLVSDITVLNTQILKQGLSEIIKIFVRIIIILVIIIFIIFAVNLTFTFISLG